MATATVNTTEQAPVTSLAALEHQIESNQKELARAEDTAREAHEQLQQITTQYNDQLKRLANGEDPDVDITDLKEKAGVLSDAVKQMQAECQAKAKELNVLCEQLSVLQAQGAKKKDRATTPLERKIQSDEKELARVEATIRDARTLRKSL